MRQALVIGNWKMHGTLASARALASSLRQQLSGVSVGVGVCPPFLHVPPVAEVLEGSDIGWGAQNLSAYPDGARTGEVSATMLKDAGCRWVIVGHSERRHDQRESDADVAAKCIAAVGQDLIPVLCVGETLAEREAGQALQVVERQLSAVVDAAGREALVGMVVAYEPVWAIGTGRSATAEQAQEVHACLRRLLARWRLDDVSILYGGSVKAGNAAELFAQPDIDGALVGGAALLVDEFVAICTAAGAAKLG